MKKILKLEEIDVFSSPFIKITKSINGSTGTATFIFKNENIFDFLYQKKSIIYKLILNYGEKILISQNVKIVFKNGQPNALMFVFIFKNLNDWNIFDCFLKEYILKHNLIFQEYNE